MYIKYTLICIIDPIITRLNKAVRCLCCRFVPPSTHVRYFGAEWQTAEDDCVLKTSNVTATPQAPVTATLL
jgi:hypothetical protein